VEYNKKRLLLQPDFCFYHIPKCGGSTIQRTLASMFSSFYKKTDVNFDQKHHGFDGMHCPECQRWFEKKYNFYTESEFREFIDHKTTEQLSQIKILLCHVKYNSPNISDKFGEHQSAVILRNPTSRLISHYEYFDYPETKVHMNKLSNNQLKEYCLRMSSVMTGFLSKNNDVSEALDNIRKINFVGDISDLDNFIEHIVKFYCKKFGLDDADYKITTRNINNNKIIDRKLVESVDEIISDSPDWKLYNQANAENII
jgi:hypothetical protein